MVDCRPLLPAAAALFALSSSELPTNDLWTHNQCHCLRQRPLNHRHYRQRQRGGYHKYGAHAFGINSLLSSKRTSSSADGSDGPGDHRHDDDAALDKTPKDAEGAVGLQTSKSEVRHRPPRVCVVVVDHDVDVVPVTEEDRRAKSTTSTTTTKIRTDYKYEYECEAITAEVSGSGSSRAAAAAPVSAANVLARQLGLPLRRLGDAGAALPASLYGTSMEGNDDCNDYTHELRYVPWRTATAAAAVDGDDDPVVDCDVALEIRALPNISDNRSSERRQRRARASRDGPLRDGGLTLVVDWVHILQHGGGTAVASPSPSSSSSSRRPGKDRLVQAVWGGRGSRGDPGRRREGDSVPLCVADLTAGWGTDALALLMAAPNSNCRILLVEQDPIVVALLRDAHRRLRSHEDRAALELGRRTATFADRITIVEGDGAEVSARCATAALSSSLSLPGAVDPLLPQPVDSFMPHVVYLDPMFPPRTKSAAVKKPMQVLHSLLQTHVATHTADADDASPHPLHPESKLLEAARRWARERVVVKRPLKADPLGGMTPSYALEGGNHRWDVYLTPPSPSHS